MAGDKKTNDLVNEIYSRISDLSAGNESHVSTALALVIIKVLNSAHKPDLSQENLLLIKENYPPATKKDIEERGLSEEGVMHALALFNHASKIVLDYSPLTNAHAEQKADLSEDGKQHQAQESAMAAYEQIKKLGFSAFGASTTLILVASVLGINDGVSRFKLARPLLEASGKVLDGSARSAKSPEEMKAIEEMAISAVCQQMGISRKEALKYLKAAKEMMARDNN